MTINEAINKVMREVGYVKKQSADGLKYTYASEQALIRALRPPMVEEGLALVPTNYDVILTEGIVTSRGTPMNRVIVLGTFTLTGRDGESMTVQALGEGTDSGDKAVNKAQTGAYKYALRQSFLIEAGDEDDPDSTPSEELAPAPPPAPALQGSVDASPSQPARQTVASGATAVEYDEGWAEELNGTWFLHCPKHGHITRGKFWPRNVDRGIPSAVSCSEKDPATGKYCKGRSNYANREKKYTERNSRAPAWYEACLVAIMTDGNDEADISHVIHDFEPNGSLSRRVKQVAEYIDSCDKGVNDADAPTFMAAQVKELKVEGLDADLPFDDQFEEDD
jgi:hypothetical protein